MEFCRTGILFMHVSQNQVKSLTKTPERILSELLIIPLMSGLFTIWKTAHGIRIITIQQY